jgi:hypothetical protein
MLRPKQVDMGFKNPKVYADFKMEHFTFEACSYQKLEPHAGFLRGVIILV